MKRLIVVLILLCMGLSNVHAVPIVAPYTRWSLFLDSTNPDWKENYTPIATTYLGTMKFLKYNTTVQTKLVNTLNMNNKFASYKTWNGGNYQQISEKDYLGECVGFAKAMTGAGGTSTWKKISTNALSNIFSNGNVGSVDPNIALAPGTMIVNFDGGATYSNAPTNHTAIILSVVTANGKVTGANVVAQNAAETAGNITNAGRMISKYFLPWSNTSPRTSFSLKNYHVIDQGNNKQNQYT